MPNSEITSMQTDQEINLFFKNIINLLSIGPFKGLKYTISSKHSYGGFRDEASNYCEGDGSYYTINILLNAQVVCLFMIGEKKSSNFLYDKFKPIFDYQSQQEVIIEKIKNRLLLLHDQSKDRQNKV